MSQSAHWCNAVVTTTTFKHAIPPSTAAQAESSRSLVGSSHALMKAEVNFLQVPDTQ